CKSCGIKLQTKDPKKPGYYILDSGSSNGGKVHIKKEDEVFNKYVNNLSPDDQKLLINDFSKVHQVGTDHLKALTDPKSVSLELKNASEKRKFKLDEDTNAIECTRCRDATYRSNFRDLSQTEYPVETIDTVLGPIPLDGKIVYVMSAQDFPMTLDPKVFQFRSPANIKFLINKSDLLFKNNELNLKYGLTFVQDYLHFKYGVPKENVMIVSGLINWNIKKVIDFIVDGSYLVGNVNSGKSTIIKSILYYLSTQKKKNRSLMSQKERTRLEKEQDKLMNIRDTETVKSRSKLRKEMREFEAFFRSKVGPGVSYIPGFTRGFIQIDLEGVNKTIYDVPGFVKTFPGKEKESHGLFRSISSTKLIKQLTKGAKVFEKGLYNSKYHTIKNGQCLTMGGVFFLNFPEQSMFQIRNCINYDYKVFNNFSKAVHVSSHLVDYPGMEKQFLVNHDRQSIQNMNRFIVPPFYGSIDLVIQGVGHINIVPTGTKASNQPLVLYLIPGVEAIIRQPITKYIAKTFTGRDANGNPLRKENYLQKSTFALQRYSAKEPFYSRLIASDPRELNHLLENAELDAEVKEQIISRDYESIAKWKSLLGGRRSEFGESTEIGPNNKYDYWVE
ncbi:uncharacterized protein CANTADRAFT_39919, partial [Suhomyces tanzawaensis NRRL Y-17324]